jgi:hypothetical protein
VFFVLIDSTQEYPLQVRDVLPGIAAIKKKHDGATKAQVDHGRWLDGKS